MSDLPSNLVLVAALLTCSASFSHSQVQTQATCTFTVFHAPGEVNGVNSFRTTVGQNSSNIQQGFIRYSGGAVSYFSAPNSAATSFTDRNDVGVSVGFYSTQGSASNIAKGFILQGSTFTSFAHPKAVWGTRLTGINKFNSTVGWYLDSAENAHGFKRYSNGGLVGLDYPGATQGTTALGINDSGTIAGSFGGSNGQHGFLYHGGTWAQVDYPSGSPGNTQLVGVSNSNVVVGFFTANEPYISFLYTNGVFKNIFVPNAFSTNVTGISANGVISGNAAYNDGSIKAFTATCN